jgi:hypothetical protein
MSTVSFQIVHDLRQAVQFGVFMEVKLHHSSDDGASGEYGVQSCYNYGDASASATFNSAR